MPKIASRLVVLALLAFLLSGCAGAIDYFFVKPPDNTAAELMELGNEAMKAKDYSKAIASYSKLKERFPFSPYAIQAELLLADAEFLDADYDQAVEAYKDFENLHPRHEAIPYVLLRIGIANYNQLRTIDLPQEHMAEALEYFHRVSQTYPGSKYAIEAEQYFLKCRQHIADHEVFVADFYFRTERYGAAYERYTTIASGFGDLPQVVEYAKRQGEMAYLKDQEKRAELTRQEREQTWRTWFKWL